MKKTLFITTLLLSAGAMFTSCNKDVENPDMQAQPEETAQVTRAYGDKTPLIEVYYEINDTNPLNALSYEMSGKKFIDLVQLFASNIQKDANGDPCIFFNDKLAPVMAAKATYIEPLQNAGIKVKIVKIRDARCRRCLFFAPGTLRRCSPPGSSSVCGGLRRRVPWRGSGC